MTRVIVRMAVIGTLLSCVMATAAQQVPEASPDARSIALAAIEWFAMNADSLKASGGTLLVSRHTMDQVSELAGESYAMQRAARKNLNISDVDLSRLGDAAGVRITACEEPSDDRSLCGTPQPWQWLVLLNPGIERDRAVLVAELLELESTRPGTKPIFSAEIYELFLSRQNGVWKVDRARVTGVS